MDENRVPLRLVAVWLFLTAIASSGLTAIVTAHTLRPEPLKAPAPELMVHSPKELLKEFRSNEAVARDKYFRRYLSVRGTVCPSFGWKTGETGQSPQLFLYAGEDGVLNFEFPEFERLHLANLLEGDDVTVRAWCSGSLVKGSESLPDVVMFSDATVETVPRGRKGFNVIEQ